MTFPSVRWFSSHRPAPEEALVVLIALHSAAIGVGALVATDWGLRFGGFPEGAGRFFPRQVGVFHLVAANAYLIEYFRYRGLAILISTKAIAVSFLVAMMAVDRLPWIVPFSALGDGLMLAAVLAVRLLRRGRAGTPAPRLAPGDDPRRATAKAGPASPRGEGATGLAG